LHRWRCRPCTPLFLWSCQRKSAVRRGERKALFAANSASAGCLFAWLRELLVRTAFGLLSVPYRVRCTQFRAEVLPRIWRLGCGLWVVEGNLHFWPRGRYPGAKRRKAPSLHIPGDEVQNKGARRPPWSGRFKGVRGEIAEAPPAADKARRFRGSGTIGSHEVAGNRIAATVGKGSLFKRESTPQASRHCPMAQKNAAPFRAQHSFRH